MEKPKASKKKVYYKNRKPVERAKAPNWRHFGKNDEEDEEDEPLLFKKRLLKQPASRLADLEEIWQETNVGQDFETLANAALSSEGHFAFKSEKNWIFGASRYDEFFSIDVKTLAMVIKCIPFNRYIEVDDKYLTTDKLTELNNTADQAKRLYEKEITSISIENEKNGDDDLAERDTVEDSCKDCKIEEATQLDKPRSDLKLDASNLDEDLDFLLSLKEPVRTHPVAVASSVKSTHEESKSKSVPAATATAATKSIDLEKWLDMVLED